jgi:tRNA dimethylallyltransferase
MRNKLVAVIGPTATGKTRLGVMLADKFNGEIISADSRQVYRGLDIGTGKDLNEYTSGDTTIKVHLIDIAEPIEEYNIFRFKKDFSDSFKDITIRGKLPFTVGGSGLYLSSVLQDYKLISYNEKTAENSDSRFNFDTSIIGVRFERKEIKKRITDRLLQRLQSGMIDEVKNLIDSNVPVERLLSLGLEYRFVTLYLTGKLNYNDMYQKLNSSIHDFAKRQMTWFRKMEKEGVKINWVEKGDFEESSAIIEKFLISE